MKRHHDLKHLRRTWEDRLRPWGPALLPRLSIVVVLWALVGAAILRAQNPPTEYEVKAAYLYQFGKFVEWPEGALDRAGDFSVCIFGTDPFGSVLDETI